VTFTDATTFSSVLSFLDFKHIQFMVEETPNFPDFVLDNGLGNRIFDRAINEITYSGPGDRFFFGNLPWFGDGDLFVFFNDLPLTDPDDYTADFNFWDILLDLAAGSGDSVRIFTTNPFHAFNALPFAEPNPTEVEELEGEFTVTGGFEVSARYADSVDNLQEHTLVEIGEAPLPVPANAKGALILLKTGDLGDVFPGCTITSAKIIVDSVTTNSLTNTAQFDAMDETFVGKTTYAALAAEYVTPASSPVFVAGTGEQEIDATDLFQAIADLDTIQQGFIVAHEEPLPADAAAGYIRMGSIIRFEVKYIRTAPATVEVVLSEGGSTVCKQRDGQSGEDASELVGTTAPETILTTLAGVTDPDTGFDYPRRYSVLLAFSLDDVPNPVGEAHLFFKNIRWTHSPGSAGTFPKVLKFRRVEPAAALDFLEVTWNQQDNTQTAPDGDWVGTNGEYGDDNHEGGAISTSDHADDATGIDLDPPPELYDNQVIKSNVSVFGFKDMIDAARVAGEDTLWVVCFMDTIVDPTEDGKTQADLAFAQSNGIKLVTNPVV
jgi:hypothetical protein